MEIAVFLDDRKITFFDTRIARNLVGVELNLTLCAILPRRDILHRDVAARIAP